MPYQRIHEYGFAVLRVLDGDTIGGNLDVGFYWSMHDVDLRFAGIDAPELTTTVDGKRVLHPPGEAATLNLMGMLGRGRFKPTRERGYFGRPGPYLLADGEVPPVLTIRTLPPDEYEKYGRVLAECWLPGESPNASPDLGERQITDGHAAPNPVTAFRRTRTAHRP